MAEHSDGSIIVDTEINSEGFKADSAELQRAVKSLSSQMDKLGPTFQKAVSGNTSALSAFHTKAETLESTIATLEEKLSALGEKRIPTDDYKWVTAEIEKAENAVERLDARQSKMQAMGVKENSKAYQSLQYDIEQARRKLDDLLATKQILENSGQAFTLGADTGEYQRLAANLDAARQRLAELRAEAAQTGEEVSSSWSQMTTLSGMLRGAFSSAFSAIRSAASTVGSAVTHPIQTVDRLLGTIITKAMQAASALRSMAAAGVKKLAAGLKQVASYTAKATLSFLGLSKSAKSANAGFASGFKTLLKYGLGIRSLYALSNKLRSALVTGFQNLAQYSDSTNRAISSVTSSLAQLKNSLATAFSPILSVVAPILSRLINMLSTAITYIGMFFAALTGAKTFTKATAVQQDYAASLGGTADAAGSAAEATEDAAEAAKEASKQLASFDELNILTDDTPTDADKSSGSDSGGGGGGGAGIGSMFEEVPIESKIADFVNRIKELFANGEYEEIGRIIGEGINRAFQKIHDFISWDNLGATLTKYIDAFCRIFNSMVDTIDWDLIGSTFAEGINTIVHCANLLLTGIDWENIGKAISTSLNALIRDVDWKLFGDTLGEYFTAKLSVVHGAVTNFNWAAAGSALAEAVNGLAEHVDWTKAGETLSSGIKGAFEFLRTAITEIDWNQLGTDIGTFISNVDWGGIINTAIKALCTIPKAIFDLVSGAITSVNWVEIAAGIANGIKNAIKSFDFEGAFSSLGKLIGSALKAALDVAKWIGEGIADGIDAAKDYFSDKIEECGGDIVAGIFKGITDAISSIKNWINEHIFTPFIEGFKKSFGIHSPSTVMAEMGGYLIEGLLQGISDWWSKITDFFASSLNNLRSTFSTSWSNIKSTVSSAVSDIYSTVKSKFSSAVSTISSSLSNIKSTVSSGFNNVKSTVSSAANNVYSTIQSKFSSAASVISSKISSMKSAVSSGFSSIVSTITEKMQGVMSTLKSMDWASVGTNICTGIKNGLIAGWNWVKTTASNLASGLVSSVKNALDINSPSRVFRDEVGYMVGLGMASGMEKSRPAILETASSIADSIAAEMAETGATIPFSVGATGQLDSSLNSFADRVSDSFMALMNRLNAIAGSVTFQVPAVAAGAVVPYSVSAKASGGSSSFTEAFEASNNDLSSVIIQSVTNATSAIVQAIQTYSGTTVNIDADSLTTKVIEEINRRTRMSGKSPLLI